MNLSLPASFVAELEQRTSRARLAIEQHPKQGALFADDAARKAICSGRRGGKTSGLGAWLVDGMLERPGTRQFYITLSASLARQILWDGALSRIKRDYGIPLELTSHSGHMMVEHPNGSSIWIAGCADKSEVDKFRGQPPFRVVVDEAQGFGDYLQTLIEDAIEPGLMDNKGAIAIAGTPGPASVGYFHDATTGVVPGWSNHHFTVLDNDRIPNYPTLESRIDYLRLKREQNGWTEQSATYRREWLGEWCDDAEALVYPFTRDNYWTPGRDQLSGEQLPEHPYGLPPGDYSYGLGVDLGFSERSTAFVLQANRRGHGELYTIRAWTESRLTPMTVAGQCHKVRQEVNQKTGSGLRIVVDEGALGAGYGQELRDLGVGCEPAVKREKRAYQEWAAGLIRGKKALVHYAECRELLEEAARLPFDPETGEEHEQFTRHCCDAWLYITRAQIPRYSPEENQPAPGSPEAIRREMAAHKQKYVTEREKRQKKR